MAPFFSGHGVYTQQSHGLFARAKLLVHNSVGTVYTTTKRGWERAGCTWMPGRCRCRGSVWDVMSTTCKYWHQLSVSFSAWHAIATSLLHSITYTTTRQPVVQRTITSDRSYMYLYLVSVRSVMTQRRWFRRSSQLGEDTSHTFWGKRTGCLSEVGSNSRSTRSCSR